MGEDPFVSLTEVTEVVKKLPSSKAAGVDEIHLDMLKVLDIVGLSWLTHFFQIQEQLWFSFWP